MTVINLFDKESVEKDSDESVNIKDLMKDYVEDEAHYEGGLVFLQDPNGSIHVSTTGLSIERLYFILSSLRNSLLNGE